MKRKIGIVLLILVIIASAFTGCGSRSEKSEDSVEYDKSYNTGMQAPEIAVTSSKNAEYALDEAMDNGSSIGVLNDKIIYTADISLETENFNESIEAIEKKTEEVKGYIQSSSINGKGFDEGDAKYGYYVLRIPKTSFNYVKKAAEQWGSITNMSSNSSDVSEQYFDTEARLETLTIQEERLLALLQKADKMEDILNIERELQNVRYQIETYTGSIRRLDSQIDYATISVNIYEVKNVTIVPKTFIQEVIEEIKASARSFGRFLEDSLFTVIYLVPYLAIIIALILIFRKRIINIKLGNPIKKIKIRKDKE